MYNYAYFQIEICANGQEEVQQYTRYHLMSRNEEQSIQSCLFHSSRRLDVAIILPAQHNS